MFDSLRTRLLLWYMLILTMVIVSWATRAQVCNEVDDVLLRLHAPERLGLTNDRG